MNPSFTNGSDPDGSDNTWRTSDDGLMPSSSSPAVNAGTNTGTPTTDILSNPRVGTRDIGAYEKQ